MTILQAAARGILWNMLFGVGARVLQLVGTLILTRFISPGDYGAVLAVSLTIVIVGTLTSFAFGQYLIVRQPGPEVAFQAMVIHTLLGIVTMAVVLAMTSPLSGWLEIPEFSRYALGFAIAHVIERVRYVPERLLIRELRFRTVATINGSSELVFTVVAVGCAMRYGANAILYATLARAIFSTALVMKFSPRANWWRVSKLHPQTARDLLSYGIPIMLASISDRAATRLDSLVISKLFGTSVMAPYNLAYSMAEMPINNIAEHIGEVLMPSFSRMQPAEREPAVLHAAELMAFMVAPLGVGLSATASTIVSSFFDSRWSLMAPMLTILSIMTVFRPLTWPAVAYLQAESKTQLVMTLSLARAVMVLVLVIVFGLLGGPLWSCVGACIGYALHSVGTIVATGAATGLRTRRYLARATRPLLACLPMYVTVVLLGEFLRSSGSPGLLTLIAQIAGGGVIYLAASWLFARSTLLGTIDMARVALLKRSKPPAVS